MWAKVIPWHKGIRYDDITEDQLPLELKRLQDIVGGDIELIGLKDSYLVVDTDGKRKGKAVNVEATVLLLGGKFPDWMSRTEDRVVGDVVWCSRDSIK